jgi:methylated-DNA-[protein]-cysteine S-methyltransferase
VATLKAVSTSDAAAAVETHLGTIGIEATVAGLSRVRLPGEARTHPVEPGDGAAGANVSAAASQLVEYADGRREQFEIELDWDAVEPSHRRILETLREIAPYGTTVTYGELGRAAGVDDPRDVGVLMARNPFPLVIPCHRVVASDGLGGFGGGLELKKRLLELEGILPPRLDLGDV